MKNRSVQKKTVLIFLFTSLIILHVSAQDSYIKNRWNTKIGFSGSFESNSKNPLIFRLETNYGISNFLEVGGYIGYWNMHSFGSPLFYPDYESKMIDVPILGLNLNYHILPYLIKRDKFRFDFYLSARYGDYQISTPLNYRPPSGIYFEYGIGLGFALYFLNHIGVFTEYNYGKHIGSKSQLRYGLTWKL